MSEVACKAIGVFFRRAERDKIPIERLLAGVKYSVEHLRNKNERIDWDTLVQFLDNAGHVWTEKELEAIGGAFVESPFFRSFAVVARLLFTPLDFYRYANTPARGAGTQLFSCITPRQRELGPNHITVDLTLPLGYRHSRAYWAVTKGGLAVMPRILGLAPAKVQWHSIENGARYDIVYPPGGGALAFVRRFFSWPFTVRAAARELKEANEALQARYKELEQARTTLAFQATQLSVAHTISQLIHGNLDLRTTLKAMAAALVNIGGFLAAHVHVAAENDGHAIEMEASEGTAEGDGISNILESRGRSIGDVRVWHVPEHDPRERRELLAVRAADAVDGARQRHQLSRADDCTATPSSCGSSSAPPSWCRRAISWRRPCAVSKRRRRCAIASSPTSTTRSARR